MKIYFACAPPPSNNHHRDLYIWKKNMVGQSSIDSKIQLWGTASLPIPILTHVHPYFHPTIWSPFWGWRFEKHPLSKPLSKGTKVRCIFPVLFPSAAFFFSTRWRATNANMGVFSFNSVLLLAHSSRYSSTSLPVSSVSVNLGWKCWTWWKQGEKWKCWNLSKSTKKKEEKLFSVSAEIAHRSKS